MTHNVFFFFLSGSLEVYMRVFTVTVVKLFFVMFKIQFIFIISFELSSVFLFFIFINFILKLVLKCLFKYLKLRAQKEQNIFKKYYVGRIVLINVLIYLNKI